MRLAERTRRDFVEIRSALEIEEDLFDLLLLHIDRLRHLRRIQAASSVHSADERLPASLCVATTDAWSRVVRVDVAGVVVLSSDVCGRMLEPERRVSVLEDVGDLVDIEGSSEEQ